MRVRLRLREEEIRRMAMTKAMAISRYRGMKG